MIRNLPWHILAFVVSIPAVANWLIARAQRTPYRHIRSMDKKTIYMGRWWLFNPYTEDTKTAPWPRLPSIRVHHIMRPDLDRHLHDHPWNARTIVLRGWYYEERFTRLRTLLQCGDTGRLLFGEYHRITDISEGGVWTLFFTWGYRGKWGYWVDGAKVAHDQYNGRGTLV